MGTASGTPNRPFLLMRYRPEVGVAGLETIGEHRLGDEGLEYQVPARIGVAVRPYPRTVRIIVGHQASDAVNGG